MVYLINYRLNKPGKDYAKLYEAIESISGTYWHNTTSSWLVQTSLSCEQICARLLSHVDVNDEIVVFRVTEWYGHLEPKDIKWLQGRVF